MHTCIHTLTHTHTPGPHKLPNGVKTKFFEALEKGKNYVMPTNADEFQDMMEMVLYNPKTYTFHQRMREALVQIQKPNYAFFHESECLFLSAATIYSHHCFLFWNVDWMHSIHLSAMSEDHYYGVFLFLIVQYNKTC